MRDLRTRLVFLFNRYYAGTATTAETAELMAMVAAAGDDAPISQLIQEAWDNLPPGEEVFSARESEAMFKRITDVAAEDRPNHSIPVVSPSSWFRYAAVVLLAIGFGVFWKLKNQDVQKIASVAAVSGIPAGGNKAMLTLADGSTIMLDSASTGLLAKQGGTGIIKTRPGQLVYNLNNAEQHDLTTRINTISTPKGGEYQVVLSDGSKVWLNAASSISFPAMFAANERKVTISGEVYFEVQKDHARPFKVLFGQTEVEVFGTSFNIMAYAEEVSSQTTLLEGSIGLQNGQERKRLQPGQQAGISQSGLLLVETVDVNKAIAWKNGFFLFKDEGVEAIMRQVSRWYDVEISYQGKVPSRQLTGNIPRNVNISRLVEMLNYAGINCRLEGRKVIIGS
jgi:transmembrane sensor